VVDAVAEGEVTTVGPPDVERLRVAVAGSSRPPAR
jgi:hypothetical protein